MAKYRKKPLIVDAFVLGEAPPKWWIDAVADNLATPFDSDSYAILKTAEGYIRAERGEYIIRGIKGELYSCKPDIFALLYEPVETK
jgi:hypothetical protein